MPALEIEKGPLDVILAIPELDRGGPDKILFHLAEALSAEGLAITVATVEPRGYYLERLSPPVRVEVLRTGSARLLRRYPVLPLARLVRRRRPDVVLTTLRMDLAALVGRVAWPSATRLVTRPANHPSANAAELAASHSRGRWTTGTYRRVVKRADAVVCQSPVLRTDLAMIGVPEDRLVVIGNGIDVEDVRGRAAEPHRPPGHPALFAVGRLTPQKGFDLLIEALPSVRRQFPDIEVTIAGEGPAREELESMVKARGLDGAVHFAGHLDDVLSWMAGADVFVLPSRYEGFANVVLESLACGTPVVAARGVSGIQETVVDGADGWLAEGVDAPALGQALLRACAQHEGVDRHGVVERCRARHSVAGMVAAYGDLLRAVAAGEPASRDAPKSARQART